MILSASGMCTGGRILHHLKHRLPGKNNAVLFVGYQPQGTWSQKLRDGAEKIRIHGSDVPVRAHIEIIDALSGHADKNELLRRVKGFDQPPSQTIIVHGEPQSRMDLRTNLERLDHHISLPNIGDAYKIA